jgi:hypothetical protein
MSEQNPHAARKITRREALGRTIGLGIGASLLAPDVSGTANARRGSVNAGVGKMVAAAADFLNLLPTRLQEKTAMPFDGWEERSNWHFFPTRDDSIKNGEGLLWHRRKGLSIKEMNQEQRVAAHALLRSALSTQGYLKAAAIMQLEEILRETEIALGGSPYVPLRDPELYFFTVFGKPAVDGAWGFRVEGHHLSVSFTSAPGGLFAVTPTFFGTRPAVVQHGKHIGLSILAAEAQIARELMQSLDSGQLAQTVIQADAPAEIVTGNSRKVEIGAPAGVPFSKLTGPQSAMLMRLVEEYVNNWRADFAARELDRIRRSGLERLHFAWAGSTNLGKPHYYRIHGPDLLIEYDNTQNNANHIHTVYRDPKNDFGADMLRQHYEKSDHD